ncbi:hypothetical protein V8B97DRAFT_2004892 [Scleroderma yunnanense]
MDAKLKALKVADLKEILAKASVPVAARTNKQDLIAKILANPAAIEVYEERYPPAETASTTVKPVPVSSNNDDLLAPPEVLDWSAVETGDLSPVTVVPTQKNPSPKQPPPAKPAQVPSIKPPTKTTTVTATPAPAPVPPSTTPKADQPVDDELEKRKARAARFGIPLIEPKQPPQPQLKKNMQTKRAAAISDDPEKMKMRAERFGPSSASNQSVRSSSKRVAPPEEADPEELERRRKRAERFNIPST